MIEDIPRIGPYIVTNVNMDRSSVYTNAPKTTITLQGQYLECVICGEAGVFICGACVETLERIRNKIQKLKQI